MLVLKRLAMFVWSLVGLVAVAVLMLSLVGPWADQIVELLGSSRAAFVTLCVLVAVLAAGLVATFVRSLVMRKPRHVVVTNMEDGAIVVTRDALASQASHVVATTPGLVARDVFVNVKRKGTVDVRVRVEPAQTINVMETGPVVHDALVDELKLLCGEHLDKVCVEFMRAKDPSLAQGSTAALSSEAPLAADTTSEITIPVGQDAPAGALAGTVEMPESDSVLEASAPAVSMKPAGSSDPTPVTFDTQEENTHE